MVLFTDLKLDTKSCRGAFFPLTRLAPLVYGMQEALLARSELHGVWGGRLGRACRRKRHRDVVPIEGENP